MDEERTKPPAQPAATAGAAARAALATSTQHALRHAAGAAKLGLALTRRPGHVIVTGPDGRVRDTLLRAAESQVGAVRLVRGVAEEGHLDDLLRSLRDVGPGERVAGVVGAADRLSAASLARLHAGLDAGALERGEVRLVLLGSPALLRTLRDDRLRPLMAHVCLQLDVPAADAAALPAPERPAASAAPRRERSSSTRRLEVAGIAAAILVGIGLWISLHPGAPRSAQKPSAKVASQPETGMSPVVAPAEAPVVAHVDRPVPSVAPEQPVAAPPPDVPPPAVEAAAPPVVAPPAVEAAAPPPVEAPAPRAPRARTGLGLQVGAFARPENATRLAARLGSRFGRVEVTTITRGATTLHRVRIVGFASEAERRAVARRLAAEGLEPLPVR